MTEIKTNILQFVEKNKIDMIPRWKFVLYSLLWTVLALFTFTALVFTGSMIMYILSTHGFIYLPLFGIGELVQSLRSIPLILFTLTIVLVVLVEMLVRHYSFSFRKPMLTTLLTLTGASLVCSFLLTLTPVHKEIRNYARDHNIGFIYHEYDRPLPLNELETMTVIRGIVVATSSDGIMLALSDDSIQAVYASSTLHHFRIPTKGEDVVVFGRLTGQIFEAVAIRTTGPFPR